MAQDEESSEVKTPKSGEESTQSEDALSEDKKTTSVSGNDKDPAPGIFSCILFSKIIY